MRPGERHDWRFHDGVGNVGAPWTVRALGNLSFPGDGREASEVPEGPPVPTRWPHSVINSDVGLGPLVKPVGFLSADGPPHPLWKGEQLPERVWRRFLRLPPPEGGPSCVPRGRSLCLTPQGAHGCALEHMVKTVPCL